MLGLGNSLITPQYRPFSSTHSVDFDGVDDYMDAGEHFSTVFDGSFTLSAWVKPDDGQPSSAGMFAGVADSDDGGSRISFILKSGGAAAGKVGFTYESNDGAYTDCETDSAVWSNGESTWRHVVATINETNGAMVIYVNGSSAGTATEDEYDDMSSYGADEQLYIGARNNNGSVNLPFAGLIDEFGIWNVALSADKVSEIYNSGIPHDLTTPTGEGLANYTTTNAKTNLQAYYRMGEGTESSSGTTVYDMSANSNNGTLTNGPVFTSVGASV